MFGFGNSTGSRIWSVEFQASYFERVYLFLCLWEYN